MLKASLIAGLLLAALANAETSFERAMRSGPYRDGGSTKYWEKNPNALKAYQASGLTSADSASTSAPSSASSEVSRLRREISKTDADSYPTLDSTLHDIRVYNDVRYEGSFDRESEENSDDLKTGVNSADDYVHGDSRKKKRKVNVESYKKSRGGRRSRAASDSGDTDRRSDSETDRRSDSETSKERRGSRRDPKRRRHCSSALF